MAGGSNQNQSPGGLWSGVKRGAVIYPVRACRSVNGTWRRGGRAKVLQAADGSYVGVDPGDPYVTRLVGQLVAARVEGDQQVEPDVGTFFTNTLPAMLRAVEVITKPGVLDPERHSATDRRPDAPTHGYVTEWVDDRPGRRQGRFGAPARVKLVLHCHSKAPLTGDPLGGGALMPWWRDPLGRPLDNTGHTTTGICSCGGEYVRVVAYLKRERDRLEFVEGSTPLITSTQAVPAQEWFDPIEHAEFWVEWPHGWTAAESASGHVEVGPANRNPVYRWRPSADEVHLPTSVRLNEQDELERNSTA